VTSRFKIEHAAAAPSLFGPRSRSSRARDAAPPRRRTTNRSLRETDAPLSLAVFNFIEAWYNPHRRHSALGYLSPNNYERRMSNAA